MPCCWWLSYVPKGGKDPCRYIIVFCWLWREHLFYTPFLNFGSMQLVICWSIILSPIFVAQAVFLDLSFLGGERDPE